MRWKPWATRGSFALVGFLAGVVVSQLTLQPRVSEEQPSAALSGVSKRPGVAATSGSAAQGGSIPQEEALERALANSWLSGLQLAAKVASLESLLEGLREHEVDGEQMVARIISTMSDREIQSIVASAAHLSPEELDEVRDMRAFAMRLAEVAMEGIVEPGEEANEARRVVFTTRPETVDPESVARDRFESNENRIYAVFPTDHYGQDAVMMKWYRRDRPQILLFERYPIQRGEAYGYVWLNRTEGWEPGEYQVDLYAADETMTRLARGRYTVQ